MVYVMYKGAQQHQGFNGVTCKKEASQRT